MLFNTDIINNIFLTSNNDIEIVSKKLDQYYKDVLKLTNDEHVKFGISSTFINFGIENKQNKFVEYGMRMAKTVLNTTNDDKLQLECEFNIANSLEFLASKDIWGSKDEFKKFPSNKYWQQSKLIYQRIWKSAKPGKHKLKAITNLALILSSVGRYIEAIDLIDEFISNYPNHGMAKSSRLRILYNFANDLSELGFAIDESKMNHFKSVALSIYQHIYQGLREILQDEKLINSILVDGFQGVIESNQEILNYLESKFDNILLDTKPLDDNIDTGDPDIDNYMKCMSDNNLFLTYNIFDKNDAFGHSHTLPMCMVTPIKDFDNKKMLSQINELKESYSWCCNLFFNASTTLDTFYEHVDSKMGYLDDQYISGFKNGLIIKTYKSIIKESYDIFDKIMSALVIYHQKDIKKTEVKWSSSIFWTIKNSGNTEFNKLMTDKHDKYLTALFDLRRDMVNEESIYKNIKEIREKVTHSTLTVKNTNHLNSDYTLDQLRKLALNCIKIARSGLIYFTMHLNMEFCKKNKAKTLIVRYPIQNNLIINQDIAN